MRVISEWSSPHEVQNRTRGQFSPHSYGIVEATLKNLVAKGLAKYGASQNTYRLTPAGSAEVSQAPNHLDSDDPISAALRLARSFIAAPLNVPRSLRTILSLLGAERHPMPRHL